MGFGKSAGHFSARLDQVMGIGILLHGESWLISVKEPD